MPQLVRIGQGIGPHSASGTSGPSFPTSGLIRAWDPALVSGNDITTMPPAFGTAVTLNLAGTSGSPDVLAGVSPALNKMVKTTGSNNEVGSFTSTGALSTWTIAAILGPTDLSVDLPFMSKSTSTTQSYIRFVKNASSQLFRVEIRPDSGTASVLNFSTAQLMSVSGCYLIIMTWDSVNGLVIRINTVSLTLAKTGTFTFDRIFQYQNGGSPTYSTALWGRVAMWNRILTAGEIAIVEGTAVGFGNDMGVGLYVSDTNGNDSNPGFSSGLPLKTLTAAEGKTQVITNGLGVGDFTINIGDSSPLISQAISVPVSGTSTKRMKYRGYAEGGGNGRGKLYGCTSDLTGWTFVTSGGGVATYTKTVAYKPNFVLYLNGSSTKGLLYTKLYDKTLGTPPGSTYFDYATTTLTVVVPIAIDPRVTPFYIAANDAKKGASFGTTNVDFTNLDLFFWNSITFHAQQTTGTVTTNTCEFSYGFNDGGDASTSGTATTTHNSSEAYSSGGLPNISGTGDNWSCHSGSIVNYNNCIGAYGQAGIRSEAHTVETVTGGFYFANAQDFIRLSQGSGSGGSFTLINVAVTMTAASTSGNAYEVQVPDSGTAANTTLQFVTFYNATAAGTTNGAYIAAGNVVVQDTIMDGFHGGVTNAGAGTGTEGNNCFHNVAFPTTGMSNIGTDITSDPQFTDTSTRNYLLQGGSPCIGAGVAIGGITTDITGATRANPPSIGAYEA